MSASGRPIVVYVDADACPVKDEVYRIAARYGLEVQVVANTPIGVPREPWIIRTVVSGKLDAADDWIAERAAAGDIVITSDIPLAARGVKNGATVLSPTGKLFDQASIGMALATRNLMEGLRSAGEMTRGPKSFQPKDRSAFLSALDLAITRLKRAGYGA